MRAVSPSVSAAPALVELQDVTVDFALRRGLFGRAGGATLRAVDEVSMRVPTGTTFGLVGESGSGKSTIGRLVVGMLTGTSGEVRIAGADIRTLRGDALRASRRSVQIILQDPFSSLDPRMRVRDIVAEPITLGRSTRGRRGAGARDRVDELLDLVGLPRRSAELYPHQFSGGQRQRIAIARALAPNPRLVVLDEPTSALDVSVRAQVLNLLDRLQRTLDLTYLCISHDLVTVAHMASTVGVMYLGRLVEVGPVGAVFASPAHPYTRLLLASVPTEDGPPGLPSPVDDEMPSIAEVAGGCRFRSRCPLRVALGAPAICDEVDPPDVEVAPSHVAACHFTDQRPGIRP